MKQPNQETESSKINLLSMLAGCVHAVGEGLKGVGKFSSMLGAVGGIVALGLTTLSLVGMGIFTLIGFAAKSSTAFAVAGGILGVWSGALAGAAVAVGAGFVTALAGKAVCSLTQSSRQAVSRHTNDSLVTLGAGLGFAAVVAAGAITAYNVFGAAKDVFKADPAPAATVERVGAVHDLQKGALTRQFKNVLVVADADQKKLGVIPSMTMQTV